MLSIATTPQPSAAGNNTDINCQSHLGRFIGASPKILEFERKDRSGVLGAYHAYICEQADQSLTLSYRPNSTNSVQLNDPKAVVSLHDLIVHTSKGKFAIHICAPSEDIALRSLNANDSIRFFSITNMDTKERHVGALTLGKNLTLSNSKDLHITGKSYGKLGSFILIEAPHYRSA